VSTPIAQTFAALGDPVRSTIVDRLAQSDATVGELVALFDISFQAVSQHLRVLEDVGLISRHRDGRTRRARLEPERLDDALFWMETRRRRLEARYRRLDAVLAGVDENAPHVPATRNASTTRKETM
jgi:DNA-binding transcriptional ArsR family regulator